MLRFDCFCLCILELLLTESRASDTSLQLNLRHMGRYQVRVKDNRSIYCCAYYFSARHNWCFVFIFVIHVAVIYWLLTRKSSCFCYFIYFYLLYRE